MAGASSQMATTTPATPATAPAPASTRWSQPRPRTLEPTADDHPEALTGERADDEDPDRDGEHGALVLGPVEPAHDAGEHEVGDHDAEREPDPREGAGHEPEAEAPDGRTDGGDDDEQVEQVHAGVAVRSVRRQQAGVGQEARVRHHPVVGTY